MKNQQTQAEFKNPSLLGLFRDAQNLSTLRVVFVKGEVQKTQQEFRLGCRLILQIRASLLYQQHCIFEYLKLSNRQFCFAKKHPLADTIEVF